MITIGVINGDPKRLHAVSVIMHTMVSYNSATKLQLCVPYNKYCARVAASQ